MLSYNTCTYLLKTLENRAHHSRDLLLKPVAADMIGTPDPISNLRPVKYYVLPNETKEVSIWSNELTLTKNENIGKGMERVMWKSRRI